MKSCLKYFSTCLLALLAPAAFAQAPNLDDALDFAVLGGTAVTCTTSVITGDVGISPGLAAAFTNTGCTITGATPPATNGAAARAQADLAVAYNSIRTGDCTLLTDANTGNDPAKNLSTLSGVTLAPGTYCIDDKGKTGLLTLNGPANGIWIFKVILSAAGDLTGTNFAVAMMGGGQACNVFWAPDTAVTMTTSALKGNILAGNATVGSITITGGSVAGRVLAAVAVTVKDTSVIGCDTLSPDQSCKRKSHKSDKSGKSGKSGKSDKSGKNDKSHKSFKSWWNK